MSECPAELVDLRPSAAGSRLSFARMHGRAFPLAVALLAAGCGRSSLLARGSVGDGGRDARAAGASDAGARDHAFDAPVPVDVGLTEAGVDRRGTGTDAPLEAAPAPEPRRDATPDAPLDQRAPEALPDLVGDRTLPEPAPADALVLDGTGDALVADGAVVEPPADAGTDRPPIPDGGALVCDLVRQDCPAGQRCDIDLSPEGMLAIICVRDLGGTGLNGTPCQNGPTHCHPGSACIQDVDRFGNPVGTPHCDDFCNADGDCPADSVCVTNTLFGNGQRLAVNVCWP
jgi:hypothetical protein